MKEILEILKKIAATAWAEIKPVLIDAIKKNLDAATIEALVFPILDEKLKGQPLKLKAAKFAISVLLKAFAGSDAEKIQLLTMIDPDSDPQEFGLA